MASLWLWGGAVAGGLAPSEPSPTVRGRALGPDGSALAGVEVRLFHEVGASAGAIATAQSAADGSFAFHPQAWSSNEFGAWWVTLSGAGLAPRAVRWPTTERIELGDVPFAPATRLRVAVTRASGGRVPHAKVRCTLEGVPLLGCEGLLTFHAESDASGVATFDRVGAGTWRVEAAADLEGPHFGATSVQVRANAGEHGTLAATDPDPVQTANVRLSDKLATVVTSRGMPFASARRATVCGALPPAQGDTQFRTVMGMAWGSWGDGAGERGPACWLLPETTLAVSSRHWGFENPSVAVLDSHRTLELELASTVTVRIQSAPEAGGRRPRIERLSFDRDDNDTEIGCVPTCFDRSRFDEAVEPIDAATWLVAFPDSGAWRVLATLDSGVSEWTSFYARHERQVEVEVRPRKAERLGALGGTVRDEAGDPLPGARVTLGGELLGSARTTTTGADGTCEFRDLPGTSCLVRAETDTLATLGRLAGDLVVPGTRATVDLHLSPRGSFDVELRRGGEPVRSGFRLLYVSRGSSGLSEPAEDGRFRVAPTVGSGFRFVPVPDGTPTVLDLASLARSDLANPEFPPARRPEALVLQLPR